MLSLLATAAQTYRLSTSQRAFVLIIGGILVLAQLIEGNAALAIAFAVLFLLAFLAQGWERVEVDARGLTIRSWRTRTIPWSDVRQVDVRKAWIGSRRVLVERSDGKRRALPAPVDGPLLLLQRDPGFDAKVEAIRACWKRHAPAGESAASASETSPRRPASRSHLAPKDHPTRGVQD